MRVGDLGHRLLGRLALGVQSSQEEPPPRLGLLAVLLVFLVSQVFAPDLGVGGQTADRGAERGEGVLRGFRA